MKIFKSYGKILILILSLILFSYSGCSDDSITENSDNLDLSVMGTSDTLDYSMAVLFLDTVKMLFKDIKLNVSSSQDSSNFKTGPFVISLNLNASVNRITSSFIPAGTYDKIKFEIHKLENNETVPDPDFADSNGRYSVVVKGSYNGSSFVYKSSKSAHQILSFQGNLFVSETGTSNVTLKIKPYIWFIDNGVYLDPANPANSNNIDNNIKNNINNNFKAFVDNDRNGIED